MGVHDRGPVETLGDPDFTGVDTPPRGAVEGESAIALQDGEIARERPRRGGDGVASLGVGEGVRR